MPGARAGHQDLRMRGMIIKNEMFVGCIGVHADHTGFQNAISVRQKSAQQRAHGFNLMLAHFPLDCFRVRTLSFMMHGRFYAIAQIGKAVEETMRRIFPDMDGTFFRLKLLCLRARLALGRPLTAVMGLRFFTSAPPRQGSNWSRPEPSTAHGEPGAMILRSLGFTWKFGVPTTGFSFEMFILSRR